LHLYFALRSLRSGIDAIYRMSSSDGFSWSHRRRVLARWEVPLARTDPGFVGKALGRVGRPANALAARTLYRGSELGYSHPAVLERRDGALLFWQAAARSRRGRRFSIGAGRLTARGVMERRIVLRPGPEGHWDSFFVADPEVVAAAGEAASEAGD
jgi:hypothetical protein